MGQSVNQPVIARIARSERPILAADVGGTHARVALVLRGADGQPPNRMLCHQRYVGAAWPSLAAILDDFLRRHATAAPSGIERCAIAIAGYLHDDQVANSNLPWPVRLGAIRDVPGIGHVAIVNDFEAVAFASQYIGADEGTVILPGIVGHTGVSGVLSAARGPVVVAGPGTGLGSAVLLPGPGGTAQVLPTEAGQIALAPADELETDIARVLSRTRPYVSVESILSGPGLLATYQAIGELTGSPTPLATPAAVSAAGVAGSDAAALSALEVFCAVLGGFVADLAMLYGAHGGVFLAGGILPQISDFLLASRFRERFFNRGVMRPFLERVPVRLVEHGHLGVVGAATMHAGARVGSPH